MVVLKRTVCKELARSRAFYNARTVSDPITSVLQCVLVVLADHERSIYNIVETSERLILYERSQLLPAKNKYISMTSVMKRTS